MDPDYALFARVVEAGSLSAAGRAMLISPAMVSKRLARLEARLGVRLIHRTTRRLALTDAGERFHADVIAILQSIREAEDRITGVRREPAGPLRVSAPTSFGRLHVAPRLGAFLARYPRIELDLNLTDAYVDLLSDRVDLAIRITAHLPASLDGRRLATNRRVLCASPLYLADKDVPHGLSDLAGHRLLAADEQMPWRLVSGRQKRAVDGRSHVRTNSSEIVRELAIAGVGIALRSLWDVEDALADGRLVQILPEWEGSTDLGIYAVYPRAPSRPAALDAFVDFFEHCFDPPPWEAVHAGSDPERQEKR
ncbi:LysR family transcriptional regulator [Sphingomonas sp. KC8]|uniref:LysR family transcriptional regulator n=1 Tax=Sphingomonas sp. KC8 TaxID=1030157 RepID=UPI000248A765|nr:LysR family transcriptional regulator [Sphingomonas sp. KC8]ARS28853.1 LysR family transcriptional regulator [Sphingomonas sp. KC8]